MKLFAVPEMRTGTVLTATAGRCAAELRDRVITDGVEALLVGGSTASRIDGNGLGVVPHGLDVQALGRIDRNGTHANRLKGTGPISIAPAPAGLPSI